MFSILNFDEDQDRPNTTMGDPMPKEAGTGGEGDPSDAPHKPNPPKDDTKNKDKPEPSPKADKDIILDEDCAYCKAWKIINLTQGIGISLLLLALVFFTFKKATK